MTELKHVFDGTRENFPQLVLENSYKGLVIVNYWKPGAGPCLRLWQTLEALSQDYAGRFLLANINTETQKALARDNGINSVPTLKLYRDGKVVESVYSAQSGASLRQVIDKYVPPAPDTDIAEAIRLYQKGRVDDALLKLVEAGIRSPDNPRIHATAIKLLLREKRYEDIEAYVKVLPASVRARENIGALQVHAKMLALAKQADAQETLDMRIAEAPEDTDAMLSRAALAMVDDDFATALELLLRTYHQDPSCKEALPRKAMLVIFALLGEQHELTRQYQKAMLEGLH
jgi:putative thioredoxin